MYTWFLNNGKVATVISINENNYILAEYASSDSQKTDAPINQWIINGKPNSFDILNALGEGWENHSIDLPSERYIPNNISARQIRLWLIHNGFQLSQIDDAINTIEDLLTRETVKIEWEYAPYVERTHPWLAPLARSLGLNEEQIDQAFSDASVL